MPLISSLARYAGGYSGAIPSLPEPARGGGSADDGGSGRLWLQHV